MCDIARENSFDTHLLIDSGATTYNFLALLEEAIGTLVDGDILFLSFSGHGGSIRDRDGDEDDDENDEVLYFYDRMLVDDELGVIWSRFDAGVRVLFICDSCHSGSIGKAPSWSRRLFDTRKSKDTAVSDAIYRSNSRTYKHRVRGGPSTQPIKCSVLVLSACRDAEEASGKGIDPDSELSLFTEALIQCFAAEDFEGNYKCLYDDVRRLLRALKATQRPVYTRIGPAHPEFESQPPFSI